MKFLKILFILFLLFELIFAFRRHEYFPMDGDMGSMVHGFNEVKRDPFGFNVLLHDSMYGGTNRYFAITTSAIYFKNAPLVFQAFCSPVKSIYISAAFIKTFTQFFLIYILSIFISGKKSLWNFDLLLAAVLIAPLFQTFGYHYFMGVIDYSVTYTFFYAFAFCFVVLFFLPFFNAAFQRRSFHFSPVLIIILCFLAVYISFNGPLNPAVMLLTCSLTLFFLFIKNFRVFPGKGFLPAIISSIKSIPPHLAVIFSFCIFLGAYSMFIGLNNSENFWEIIPIGTRYERLWQGLVHYYTNKLGQPLLVIMIIINSVIIWRSKQVGESDIILRAVKWCFVIVIAYIIMLPLGGYRNYRPFIIRNDTLVPVTVSLILFYGLTAFHILTKLNGKYKTVYYLLIGVCMFAYINADTELHKFNKCERDALTKISMSKEKFVFIDSECSILNWGKTPTYSYSSGSADMLQYWGVTKEKKLFYQK